MANLHSIMPILKQVAPHLSRRFFICQASSKAVSKDNHSIIAATKITSPLFRSIRENAVKRNSSLASPMPASAWKSPKVSVVFFHTPFRSSSSIAEPDSLPITSSSASSESDSSSSSFFPETSSRSVALWLLASAVSVYGIVVFGGLTRLTESGLSITEWRPVTGSMPPRSHEDWESAFKKYQASPEFQLLNPRMSLDEFKKIYWMEWTHRLWGRVVGATFVLPALYFVARRKVSKKMTVTVATIAGLIGFQGFLGWWMVKSGLKDDLFAPGSHPRVSQYRLTAHLGTAFICYTAMLWSGLSILRERKALRNPREAMAKINTLENPALKVFRRSVISIAALVFVTAMSGGLVAGLDAGLIYNEFPWMGERLTPPKSELWSDFYSKKADKSDLWWRNMLENPSLVQLDHRILATTTFTAIMGLWAYSRFSPTVRSAIPRNLARGVHGLVGFAWLQVALGLTTLLYLVPVHAASSHQAGALALLSMATIMVGRGHVSKRTVSLLSKKLRSTRSDPISRTICAN